MSSAVPVPQPPRRAFSGLRAYSVELVVFVVALAGRLIQALAGGGWHGNYGYDASVYFAAGDALTHGQVAYRDFVLLHPPALMIVLTPFAVLARLTTDEKGFIAANLAFTVIGSLNAVLTARVARRMGLGSMGAAVAGLFYALWYGSIQAEYLARLEPLGNLFLLGGLLAMLAARRSVDDRRGYARWVFWCGAALSAAASSKIWWGLPLVVVLVWLVICAPPAARLRTAVTGVGGALAAFVVIDGVFFVSAPSAMLHELVTDQLDRPKQPPTVVGRLGELANVHRYASGGFADAILVLVAGLLLLAGVFACRVVDARVMVVLTVLELGVLLDSPHWSGYYGDFLTPSLALTIAAATYGVARLEPVRGVAVGATLLVAAVVMAGVTFSSSAVKPFPKQLARAVKGIHCVQSDSPMALIELNVLSRNMSHDCMNWPDVSGRTYSVDAERNKADKFYSRPKNRKWQRDVVRYLRSGQAVILIRPDTGLSKASRARVVRDGKLKCAKKHCVYRVVK